MVHGDVVQNKLEKNKFKNHYARARAAHSWCLGPQLLTGALTGHWHRWGAHNVRTSMDKTCGATHGFWCFKTSKTYIYESLTIIESSRLSKVAGTYVHHSMTIADYSTCLRISSPLKALNSPVSPFDLTKLPRYRVRQFLDVHLEHAQYASHVA